MLHPTEDILNSQVSGFHQYVLDAPAHLCYVSQNLCDMLGVSGRELVSIKEDRYAQFVHPADRTAYARFLRRLPTDGASHTTEYRLTRKDGSVFWVRDTLFASQNPDGTRVASSTLTDISDLKEETLELQFLKETIPCGFLKYTCDKQPKITYMNQTMQQLLRFPAVKAGELDYLELYKSNIFLLIPMEERRRFSLYLNRVYSADAPIAGEMTLLRCDGTQAHIFGWVTKHTNENGVEEFQSVCMDITERHYAQKSRENQRYLKALTDVYDKIFAFNLEDNTLTCLHCEAQSSFKHLENVAMQIESASEKWIADSVIPEDQALVRRFFQDFCQKKLYGPDAKPPQIRYRARASDGTYPQYIGTFIKTDASIGFYCCRRVVETEEARALRLENDQLKENMKALVTRFMDGLAAFEISADGLAKPLYASENVCQFFDCTPEDWLTLMDTYTPIEQFIARSKVGRERFEALLQTGEAEFTYWEHKTNTQQRIKAVCSQREADSLSPRYVMLYAMESNSPGERSQSVFIRTFGYFDVFVGDQPIAFRNKKAKELLAILVDRRGGYITSEEAICFLWEDEPVNPVTLARYRKAALRLKNTLEEYGIADILESVDGKRRIVPEKIQCDLYQYLSGQETSAQLFNGSYLTNYSWSEATLGELTSRLK